MNEPVPSSSWPPLPLNAWRETYGALHLWTQIVGKIRMARAPMVNHWWHVPLYVTCNGLTTGNIPHAGQAFEIDFDFIRHRLNVGTSNGENRSFALGPMSVADFHGKLMDLLGDLDLKVEIWPVPVEMPGEPIPFGKDEAPRAYASSHVKDLHRILVQVDHVLHMFRGRFTGKSSPVHFFWGAFDLCVTRFSGREAPPHPGGIPNVGDHVMREAYSHEVSSVGFWPGGGLVDEAAFYAYAYPEPAGFDAYPVQPSAAYYHPELREYILPYEAVRTAASPDEMLLQFLQTTYEAAAERGNWNRDALEQLPTPV